MRARLRVAGQIGDGARDLEHTPSGARREAELLHRSSQQRARLGGIEPKQCVRGGESMPAGAVLEPFLQLRHQLTVHEGQGAGRGESLVFASVLEQEFQRRNGVGVAGKCQRKTGLERVVEKMSKSKGNVINPDEVIREHGADSMRLYEMFIGPLEKAAPWSKEGIQGIDRFLQRAWRLFHEDDEEKEIYRAPIDGAGTDEQRRLTAQTIAGVTEDLEAMRFNTAISKLMVFARDIAKGAPIARESAEVFTLLLAPMAPHLAEELWSLLGNVDTLAREPWPEADENLLVDDEITLVVQVNGKKRGEIRVPADSSNEVAQECALAVENVQKILDGREPKKVIVVPGRLVNIVG